MVNSVVTASRTGSIHRNLKIVMGKVTTSVSIGKHNGDFDNKFSLSDYKSFNIKWPYYCRQHAPLTASKWTDRFP